jgi:pantoate kinase
MTPEHNVKRRVKEILKSFGKDLAYCMPIGTGYGNSGIGDFVFCYRGKYHEVETKAGDNVLTGLQSKRQQDVTNAGGKACVIRESNIAELRGWIRGIEYE